MKQIAESVSCFL